MTAKRRTNPPRGTNGEFVSLHKAAADEVRRQDSVASALRTDTTAPVPLRATESDPPIYRGAGRELGDTASARHLWDH